MHTDSADHNALRKIFLVHHNDIHDPRGHRSRNISKSIVLCSPQENIIKITKIFD